MYRKVPPKNQLPFFPEGQREAQQPSQAQNIDKAGLFEAPSFADQPQIDRQLGHFRISIELPQHQQRLQSLNPEKEGISAASASSKRPDLRTLITSQPAGGPTWAAEPYYNSKPQLNQQIQLMKSTPLQSVPQRSSLQDSRGFGSLVVLASTLFQDQEAFTLLTKAEAHSQFPASGQSDATAVAWRFEALESGRTQFYTEQQLTQGHGPSYNRPGVLELPLASGRTLAPPKDTPCALISQAAGSEIRMQQHLQCGAPRIQTQNLAALVQTTRQVTNPINLIGSELNIGVVKSAGPAITDNLHARASFVTQAQTFTNNNNLLQQRPERYANQRCSLPPQQYLGAPQSLQAFNLLKSEANPARTSRASFFGDISPEALLMARELSSSSNESSSHQKLEIEGHEHEGREFRKPQKAVVHVDSIESRAVRDQLPRGALVEVEWGVPLDQLPYSSKSIHYCVPKTDKYQIFKYKNPQTARFLKLLKCDFDDCERTFTKWHNFYDHLRYHTKERPYKCPYKQQLRCDFAFSQKSNLNKHIVTHQTKHPGILPDSEAGSQRLLGKRRRPL